MAYEDLSSADDNCLKNHPYRNTFNSTTTEEYCPDTSGDLEKIDPRHGLEEADIRAQDQNDETHLHDNDGENELTTQMTFSTVNESHVPSRLPERVASRMSSTSALTFPEGGLDAWLAVAGSFCAMMSIFGLINSSAVFESYFSDHQLKDYSSSQIGWIFSLYLFMVFFVGIQVGPIFDRYGPRYLVPSGCLCQVLSLMLLGLCTKYYQILLTYSVLGGLGGALLNAPAYGTLGHHFDVRRGLATGIATTAGGIGGIIFPIMMQKTLPQLGFAWTTRILSFIQMALAVPACLWIKSRLPPRRENQVPNGVEARWYHKFASLVPSFRVFNDKRYALAAVGIFFMEWGLFTPLTFIVSYGAEHGQTVTSSYVLLAFLNAGSVIGRVLPGIFSDHFGRFNVIIVTIALCLATTLGLWLPAGSSQPLTIAFAVLFGFASGSNLGLVPVCLGQLCDTREYGRYITTANFVASFGTLTSPPIGGALLGVGGDKGWMAIILYAGLSYAIALICLLSARVLAVGWHPKKKF